MPRNTLRTKVSHWETGKAAYFAGVAAPEGMSQKTYEDGFLPFPRSHGKALSRKTGRGVAIAIPRYFYAPLSNTPFAACADLLLRLCRFELSKYTKYSKISNTGSETKSHAQSIKKVFLEDA
jgi:hypothetical protein